MGTIRNIITKISITTLLLANLPIIATAEVFSDIENSNPYFIAITYLSENEIINGYPDGSFKPFNYINRAELLKILLDGNNIETVQPESNCFPDVPYKEWSAPYICTAKSLNLINGYPDGTFRPEQNINKVETLKIIGEVFEWNLEETLDTKIFSDTSDNEWFSPYIKYAKAKNLLPEQGDTYYPTNNITRGNTAEILFRFLAISELKENIYSNTTNENILKTLGIDTTEESAYPEITSIISLNGIITDAQTGDELENTSITLYKSNDDFITNTTSTNEGIFELNDIPVSENDYLLFSKDEYFSFKIPVKELKEETVHISLSRTFTQISPEKLRVVLTWGGTETDFDAHLLTPNSEEIFFMYRISSDSNIILDIDSTGKFGTETITIKELNTGTYEYFVHNYSKENSFYNSGIRIEIYDANGLVKIYNPPDKEGEIWKVFQLNEKGEITDINEVGNCEIIEKYSSICLPT
jgi:hypothetical protein